MSTTSPLLRVENLSVQFGSGHSLVRAVDGVDLEINPGEILAVVGESGSGKTVLSRSVLRLIREPPARITSGRIFFEGRDVMAMRTKDLRELRGNSIAMIFQEPMTSLTPVLTIGYQISEALRKHRALTRQQAKDAAIELLEQVGIANASLRYDAYPNQLSGGMCQRAMIAMALACRPRLLIADEPTTALDVTIQAQILTLLRRLRGEIGMAVLLITHNLGVVAEMADRVAVMYAGRIVETSDVHSFFSNPLHPYSQGLMNSIPRLDKRVPRLHALHGGIRPTGAAVEGCSFRERCPHAMQACFRTPVDVAIKGTRVACWLHATPEEVA